MSKHKELLQELGYFAQSARTAEALMEHMVQRLHGSLTRYNWVGFYLKDKKEPNVLVLGQHIGSFDPHERISMDKGLCGLAATIGKTVVVNNVANDPRYMAGSDLVKSEIVAPFSVRSEFRGELDINSYFVDTFTREDQAFVESCAALVGRYMEKDV